MSVKHVKTILLVTAVLLSTSLILFKTITSKNESEVNQSGVVQPPDNSEVNQSGVVQPPDNVDNSTKPEPPPDNVDNSTKPEPPHQIFQSIVPQLQQQTQLPLLLPSFVPGADYDPVYPVVSPATSDNKYEIMLGYTEDCNGETACRLGTISAERLTVAAKELTGERVDLASGITGYFVDFTCGASCSDATISWDHKGSRYTLGLKGKKETLEKMANSAITARKIGK
ncbi:MAG: hypothetical protein GDA43_19825 [Hormoscilla sp. SP5CHS1]|nr:hypothetical protein [Hormoscilla sp. SP5CHS1]